MLLFWNQHDETAISEFHNLRKAKRLHVHSCEYRNTNVIHKLWQLLRVVADPKTKQDQNASPLRSETRSINIDVHIIHFHTFSVMWVFPRENQVKIRRHRMVWTPLLPAGPNERISSSCSSAQVSLIAAGVKALLLMRRRPAHPNSTPPLMDASWRPRSLRPDTLHETPSPIHCHRSRSVAPNNAPPDRIPPSPPDTGFRVSGVHQSPNRVGVLSLDNAWRWGLSCLWLTED